MHLALCDFTRLFQKTTDIRKAWRLLPVTGSSPKARSVWQSKGKQWTLITPFCTFSFRSFNSCLTLSRVAFDYTEWVPVSNELRNSAKQHARAVLSKYTRHWNIAMIEGSVTQDWRDSVMDWKAIGRWFPWVSTTANSLPQVAKHWGEFYPQQLSGNTKFWIQSDVRTQKKYKLGGT